VVGIFIVNNNPETMALASLQPTVCISVGVIRLILLFEAELAPQPESRVRAYQVALHVPSVFERKYAGGRLRPCSKKPGAVSRLGTSRSFGEYALLEDSRYMSQEELLREID
jgi:hypothetical protein